MNLFKENAEKKECFTKSYETRYIMLFILAECFNSFKLNIQ